MLSLYALLLIFSGLGSIIVALAISGPSILSRVLSGVVGAVFLGYGLYLVFLFQGGHYVVFYYALILPVLLAWRAFQARKSARAQQQPMIYPGAPVQYPYQPGQPYPPAPGGYPPAQPQYPQAQYPQAQPYAPQPQYPPQYPQGYQPGGAGMPSSPVQPG